MSHSISPARRTVRLVLRPVAATILAAVGVLGPVNAQWFGSSPRQLAQAQTEPAAGPQTQRVGRYDFAYGVTAHPRVRPIQVFDDGEHTYFQFSAGEAIPAIFKIGPTGPLLAAQTFEGPYLRVEGTAGEFLLRMGTVAGQVKYTGAAQGRYQPPAYQTIAPSVARSMDHQEFGGARAGTTLAQAGGAGGGMGMQMAAYSARGDVLRSDADPYARSSNSYATPIRGDIAAFTSGRTQQDEYSIPFAQGSHALSAAARRGLEKLATSVSDGASVVVVGREDDSMKEGLEQARARAIRSVLVARGVREENITVRLGVGERAGKEWLSHVRVLREARPERTLTAQAGGASRGDSAALDRARAWQAQQGVPASQHAMPAQPGRGVEAPADGFAMSPSDGTISGALRRWAQATGYQVVWEVPRESDPAIRGVGRLNASSIKEAMEALMTGLRDKGYHVDMAIYAANRVIVVRPLTPNPQSTVAALRM